MTRQIPESDWKIFRQLHPVALERFCERTLSEVGRLASDTGKSAHERYLAVFRLIQRGTRSWRRHSMTRAARRPGFNWRSSARVGC
jgi:hypothetical protein